MADFASPYPQFYKYMGTYRVKVFYYGKLASKGSLFEVKNGDFWVKVRKNKDVYPGF